MSRRQILHNRFFDLGWAIEIGATLFTIIVGVWHWELIGNLIMILWSQGWTQLILFLVPPLFLLILLVLAYYRFGSLWYHYRRMPQYRQVELAEEKDLEPEPVEIEGPHLQSYKETTSDFSRAAVLLIALSVFGSAVCGLGYSYAVSQAGEAAHEALQSVAEMHDRSSRLHATINHLMVEAANMEEHRVRAAVARQHTSECLRGEKLGNGRNSGQGA